MHNIIKSFFPGFPSQIEAIICLFYFISHDSLWKVWSEHLAANELAKSKKYKTIAKGMT